VVRTTLDTDIIAELDLQQAGRFADLLKERSLLQAGRRE
jgi:hypothetical protein